MSQVGATIKRAMAKAQLSQNQLADETGVSRSWIASVNTGKIVKPDPSKLARIAPVLGLDLNQLLAMTDQLSAVLVKPVALPTSDVALAAVLEAVRVQTDELHRLWSVQAERAERQDADMRALVTGLTSLVQELRADREERTGRGEAAADYLGRIEAGVGELLQRSTPEGESAEPPARAGKVR